MESDKQPKRTWVNRFAKPVTFVGGGFFHFSTLLTPTGVTVPWSLFLATYGVTLLLGLLGLACFLVCRKRGERLSPVYAVCSSLFVISFVVATLAPIYRLRWDLVSP